MANQDDKDELEMVKASFFPSDSGLCEPEELQGVDSISDDDIPVDVQQMNSNVRAAIDATENLGIVHLVTPGDVKKIQNTVDKLKKEECLKFEHGFDYKSNCRICNMAFEDSDLHKECINNNFNPTKLMRYCFEIHGEKVKWDQAKRHIEAHLLPVYNKNANSRRDLRIDIRKSLREKEKTSLPMRMAESEEMLCRMMEDIVAKSDPSNVKEHRENARVVASLSAARKSIWELMLKMMNVDQSPEEMQKILLNAVNARLQEALKPLPEDEKRRMITLLQDNTKTL